MQQNSQIANNVGANILRFNSRLVAVNSDLNGRLEIDF